jgi:beta-lactamase superfamily II metal-dependent hydrolase
MITLDAYDIAGIVFVMLIAGILWAMKWASRPQPQPEEECVEIRWSWEDVQMLRPDLSENECHVMLMRIGDKLHELSVSEGWTTMDYLIQVESE